MESAVAAPTATSDGGAPTATSDGGEPTAIPGETTIIIAPAPTDAAPIDQPTAPIDQPTAVAPIDEPTAVPPVSGETPVVVEPTAVPPVSGGTDVSAANPAIVPNSQRIIAGSWDFVADYGYGLLRSVGTGTYGGVAPSRGQWLALTIAAANTGPQPATIPDGFFVLKDAQNRVYDFNRAASVDWLNQFGRGYVADTGAADQFNTVSQSVILVRRAGRRHQPGALQPR